LVRVFPPTTPAALPSAPVNIFVVFITASWLPVPLIYDVPKLLAVLRDRFVKAVFPTD
jgi:hypothetical protein